MKRGLAEFVDVLFVSFASLAYGAERPVRIAYPGISVGAMVPALAIGEVSSKALEKLVEIAKQQGKVSKETPVSDIVDFRLLREVRTGAP